MAAAIDKFQVRARLRSAAEKLPVMAAASPAARAFRWREYRTWLTLLDEPVRMIP
jgi:hypothetical protein